jgi:hypothetical protein
MANPSLHRDTAQLRRKYDALAVLVITADEVSYSVDPKLSPRDFGETVETEIPKLVESLAADRQKTR